MNDRCVPERVNNDEVFGVLLSDTRYIQNNKIHLNRNNKPINTIDSITDQSYSEPDMAEIKLNTAIAIIGIAVSNDLQADRQNQQSLTLQHRNTQTTINHNEIIALVKDFATFIRWLFYAIRFLYRNIEKHIL